MTDNQELTEKELTIRERLKQEVELYLNQNTDLKQSAYDLGSTFDHCDTEVDLIARQLDSIKVLELQLRFSRSGYKCAVDDYRWASEEHRKKSEQLTQTQQALDRAVEALKFYAEPGDYKAPYAGGLGKLYYDCGQIAKAALASISSKETNKTAIVENNLI